MPFYFLRVFNITGPDLLTADWDFADFDNRRRDDE